MYVLQLTQTFRNQLIQIRPIIIDYYYKYDDLNHVLLDYHLEYIFGAA